MLTAINFLDKYTINKTVGLPDEVFYFISRTTPLVNVDLLIKDKKDRTLLSWRDDEYSGTGWHVPGGIVRFKEELHSRISKVALNEIGTSVKFDDKPIAVNEFILPHQENRAHFISFLYMCYTPADFEIDNKEKNENIAGFLKWHNKCPDDILSVQSIYRQFI